jgi:phosphate transport system protein
MRPKLEMKIAEIDELLLEMGTLAEEQLAESMKALTTQNVNLAKKIIANDERMDALEMVIEKKCLDTIALQNPLSGDLRKLSSIMKIITDLERIGDHCVNIAEIIVEIGDKPPFKPLVDIPKMARIVQEMVNSSLDSYIRRDVALATLTAQRDDEVDALYVTIYKELLNYIHEDKTHMDQIVSLLFIGRFLERIADHVTNICERSIFIANGTRVNF